MFFCPQPKVVHNCRENLGSWWNVGIFLTIVKFRWKEHTFVVVTYSAFEQLKPCYDIVYGKG